ncbi:hypothetical protein nbrc107696_12220 [Gordonia spumicola]|uniref:PucR family transcriptional regulator n=1 Tax=Gordonia spumicola TaxID=589161 RepID=A0A7I9V5W3_9ACTN|nr:helix-turn-helix domain-containing protein [Gordonia spumicola]GEE00748.1 hypothetical protein nbrc107696_11940 [Gordonia spumicola]GEE00776.1 hypothetical protein nbrc107696_12220 [Gordonia spumicola]
MTEGLVAATSYFADRMSAERAAVRSCMHRRVTDEVPGYFSRGWRDRLHGAAVTSTGHDALELIAQTVSDVIRTGQGASTPPARVFEEVPYAARAGIPWGLCEDAYRACMTGMWDWIILEVQQLPYPKSTQLAVVDKVTHIVFRWFDAAIRRAREEFLAERAKLGRSAARRRAELLRDLAAGRSVSEVELGYPLHRWHRMFILWRPGGALDGDRLRSRFGANTSLAAEADDGSLWIVIGTMDRSPAADIVALLDLEATVRVAASSVHHGVSGLVDAFHEASATYSLALRKLDGRPRQVTAFDEVDVETLLAWDMADAARTAGAELGVLADAGPKAERLRATLESYLSSGCNAAATAKALHMSERAVRHRLQAIEASRTVPIPSRIAQLSIALRVHRALEWREKRSAERTMPVPIPADVE